MGAIVDTGLLLRPGRPLAEPGSLPFDPIAVAPAAAWSVRRLLTSYDGPCLRVRRLNGDEEDFGFVGVDLDTAAVEAFCDGGDGWVTRWYNQGSAHPAGDMVQTGVADQPMICEQGAVIRQGRYHRPAVRADGGWMQMQDVSAIMAVQPGYTVLFVAAPGAGTHGDEWLFSGAHPHYEHGISSTRRRHYRFASQSANRHSFYGASNELAPWEPARWGHRQRHFCWAEWDNRLAGKQQATNLQWCMWWPTDSHTPGRRLFISGGSLTGRWRGAAQEIAWWPLILSAGSTNEAEASQVNYFGVP